MKVLALAPALALAAATFVAPSLAEATPRHGHGDRGRSFSRGFAPSQRYYNHDRRYAHRYYGVDRGYAFGYYGGYYAPSWGYDYSPYPTFGYNGYGYGVSPYYSPYPTFGQYGYGYGYGVYPPPRYYHRRYYRHRGPRIGIFLGF